MQFQGELMYQTWENGKKSSFEPDLAHLVQIRGKKICLRQSLDIMVNYHHELMIQSWENLVTDGQTNESDFIGRCPTNVECPKLT